MFNIGNALSSVVGGVVGVGGDLASGAKSAYGSVQDAKAKTNVSGESESLNAIRKSNENQDKVSAQVTMEQDKANERKKWADMEGAIEAGRADTHNKRFSAEASNIKGMQY